MFRLAERTSLIIALGLFAGAGAVLPAAAQDAEDGIEARKPRHAQPREAEARPQVAEERRAAFGERLRPPNARQGEAESPPRFQGPIRPERHEPWGDALRERQAERRAGFDIRDGAAPPARDARRPEPPAQDWRQAREEAQRAEAARRADAAQQARAEEARRRAEDAARRDGLQADARMIAEQRAREEARRGNWEDRRDRDARPGRDWRDDPREREAQRRRYEQDRRQAEQWQREQARRQWDYERRQQEAERARRAAQLRYQRDYWRRWQAEQARWEREQARWSWQSPYYAAPARIRYGFDGGWYYTNQYGADLLERAVRDGYREGWYAGRADRQDGWRYDPRGNYAWIDASFGYPGYLIGYDAYRHYFREGFERGYRDGYYARYQYGYYDRRNDYAVILPVVLAAILGFSLH